MSMFPDPVRLAIVLYVISASLELIVLLTRVGWRQRRLVARINIGVVSLAAGMLVTSVPHLLSSLLFIVSIYRFINLLKIVENRAHEDFLRRTVTSTSLSLLATQAGLFLLWTLSHVLDGKPGQLLWALVLAQVIVSAGLLLVTLDNLRRYRFRGHDVDLSDKSLPSVTVAIPARNEMFFLGECIQAVLASDYPKLEVLVLDDSSHDETAAIIRGFAHKGVRFIKGKKPKSGWLAKNNAYEQLLAAATGKYVLFLGVDIRLSPDAIRQLVTTATRRQLAMLSILPSRTPQNPFGLLIQPMRYWWELVLPRRFFREPSSLSSAWLVEKAKLVDLGGFAAVKRKIRPDAYFAREFLNQDAYGFRYAGATLGVASVKTALRQFDTAIRTRYPEAHRSIARVFVITMTELGLLAGPFIVLAAAAIWSLPVGLTLLAALAAANLILIHVLVLRVFARHQAWLGLFNFPVVALVEIALINLSMWKYEFSKVIWRGRNIAEPVMHVVPRLPKV